MALDTSGPNPNVWTQPIHGFHLQGRTLLEQTGTDGSLLVFLRHLGCTFCRQMVAELKAASMAPGFPRLTLVFQGPIEEGERFFGARWPEASVIHDADASLYKVFGCVRGDLNQLFGPRTVLAGLKGLIEGHGVGKPVGDPMLMPGLFFVRGCQVLWRHDFRHAGDHPDFARLPELVRASGARS